MNNFGVGQDEFIFRMYSIALIAISAAAAAKGDLRDGIAWMTEAGTYAEQQANVPMDERKWSAMGKFAVMLLFSSMGFFGSSCSAAITKNFGALTMSITSTARKATTLFLSFILFDNVCTYEHLLGIVVFISSLTAKSMRRKGKRRSMKPAMGKPELRRMRSTDLEMGNTTSATPPRPSHPLTGSGEILVERKSLRRAPNSGNGPIQRSSPRPRYHLSLIHI